MDRMPKVLAIDDDKLWLEQIPMILDQVEIHCSSSIDEGLFKLSTEYYDIVLLDLNFEGDYRTGYDVFKKIATLDHSTDIIVISGETRAEKLFQIINAGVSNFIPKPCSPSQIRKSVNDILEKRAIRLRSIQPNQFSAHSPFSDLIGSSEVMLKLKSDIQRIVDSQTKDILLIGETGTGKEVVARTITALSDPSKRMIPIHCGAISDGIAESELFGHVKGAFTGADKDRASAFEAVGGGYIFLDEIAEMPLQQQAKLLRILQERVIQRVGDFKERKVSFRSISATNADLKSMINEKTFREDLYYRIAKEVIYLPSLRDRIEDLRELSLAYFGKEYCGRVEVSDSALALLKQYKWPGNIRQLFSVLDHMASRLKNSNVIRESHVLQAIPELGAHQSSQVIKSFLGKEGASLIFQEKKKFQKALFQARGNRTKAAKILNISRATFFRRAKDLGLVNSKSITS